MSGKDTEGGVLDDDDDEEDGDGYTKEEPDSNGDDDGEMMMDRRSPSSGHGKEKDDKDYFQLPSSLSGARHFKGITKNKKAGEIEVTVRLPCR